MVRTYAAVWIVAWASWASWAAGFAVTGGRAKITKCCPRDTVLKLDMRSCVGYAGDDNGLHESFDWLPSDDTDLDAATRTSDEKPILALSNSSSGNSVPWWIPSELEFLRASNLSDTFEPDGISFDADGRTPCKADDWESLIIDNNMAVLDDGRLIMFGEEDRSVGVHRRLSFTDAEYCIDRVLLFDNITASHHDTGDRINDDGAANATDVVPLYAYVALVCRPCSRITCVPKCCSKRFVLEYRGEKGGITGCRKMADNARAAIRLKSANGTELERKDYYFFGMKPPDCGSRNWYMLNKSGPNAVGYGLLPDGRIQLDDGVVPIERDEYCVDAVNVVLAENGTPASDQPPTYSDVLLACRLGGGGGGGSGGGATSATGGAPGGPLEFREILYGVYFVVGAMFLAATLLIYVVLPELRVTVHSGNLIAHTACLFVSYATLAATTLVGDAFNYYACVVAGFVIQFSFLAAFFWLNVMCADIAWTFSGFRLLLYSNKIENEKKKYIIYSAYAWGCSIGISLLTALAEFTKLFGDQKYKPKFGQEDCWFSNKLAVGIFFYLPIGLLLLTNVILFLFTAFRIVFIRRDTSKVLNRQSNQNNMRLSLYLKLFCLMGVTFVFEIVSWAVTVPPYYWYVTDAINSLRGVFVFFIFCWKRSVLNLLLARTPKSTRDWFVEAFGIRTTNRYPSFSSAGQPNMFYGGGGGGGGGGTTNASTRTRASTMSTQDGSFQLSQFGSNTSMATSRKFPSQHQ